MFGVAIPQFVAWVSYKVQYLSRSWLWSAGRKISSERGEQKVGNCNIKRIQMRRKIYRCKQFCSKSCRHVLSKIINQSSGRRYRDRNKFRKALVVKRNVSETSKICILYESFLCTMFSKIINNSSSVHIIIHLLYKCYEWLSDGWGGGRKELLEFHQHQIRLLYYIITSYILNSKLANKGFKKSD